MSTTPKRNALFAVNLLMIVALGVGVSGWILRYTDWFPVIGGLLTLGGLFSWLAVVSKILPDDVLKELQWSVYSAVFNSKLTLFVHALLVSVLLALGSHLGTIEVRSFDQNVTSRPYALYSEKSKFPGAPKQFQADGSARELLWTSLWRPAEYTVKVSGYPAATVPVSAWSKVSLYVPQSFLRPVVVVRPTVEFLRVLGENTVHLVVDGGAKKWNDENYTGYAFWLTCEEDIRISSERLLEMKIELANNSRFESKWFPPRRRGGDKCEELPGPKFKLLTLKEDKTSFTPEQDFEVSQEQTAKDFLQVVHLDYIKTNP